ncbi:MAG: hypothetical protein QXL72_04075, partial [Candidatus Caldarchaeum sp.]
ARILLGESTWITTGLAVLAMVIITVILLRTDWETMLQTLKKTGWKGVLQNLGVWRRNTK